MAMGIIMAMAMAILAQKILSVVLLLIQIFVRIGWIQSYSTVTDFAKFLG